MATVADSTFVLADVVNTTSNSPINRPCQRTETMPPKRRVTRAMSQEGDDAPDEADQLAQRRGQRAPSRGRQQPRQPHVQFANLPRAQNNKNNHRAASVRRQSMPPANRPRLRSQGPTSDEDEELPNSPNRHRSRSRSRGPSNNCVARQPQRNASRQRSVSGGPQQNRIAKMSKSRRQPSQERSSSSDEEDSYASRQRPPTRLRSRSRSQSRVGNLVTAHVSRQPTRQQPQRKARQQSQVKSSSEDDEVDVRPIAKKKPTLHQRRAHSQVHTASSDDSDASPPPKRSFARSQSHAPGASSPPTRRYPQRQQSQVQSSSEDDEVDVRSRARKKPTLHQRRAHSQVQAASSNDSDASPPPKRSVARSQSHAPGTSSPATRRYSRRQQSQEPSDEDGEPVPHSIIVTVRDRSKEPIVLKFISQNFSKDDVYAHARDKDLERFKECLDEICPKVSEAEISEIADHEYSEILNNWIKLEQYERSDRPGKQASEKQLREEFYALKNKGTPSRIEKHIQEKIRKGVNQKFVKVQGDRYRVTLSDILTLWAQKDQFPHKFSYASVDVQYNTENTVIPPPDNAALTKVIRAVQKFENETPLICNCKNGCTKRCPCALRDDFYKKTRYGRMKAGMTRKEYIQSTETSTGEKHFKCSKRCGCKAECCKSFLETNLEDTEVLLDQHHPTQKQFLVRTTKLFPKGETIFEMTGEIQLREQAVTHDYTLDFFWDEHAKAQLKLIVKKKFKLSDKYIQLLKKLMPHDYSMDPAARSMVGRFSSHSCFGNARLRAINTEGFSPLKARVFFVATMPIYPNMEVAWKYSDNYMVDALRDVCECGQLCCVRNWKLLPYITKDHLIKYYTLLYNRAYKEYKENVWDPLEQERKTILRVHKAQQRVAATN